jgi:hypothetical protein
MQTNFCLCCMAFVLLYTTQVLLMRLLELYPGASRVAVGQSYIYLSFSVLLELITFRVCRRMNNRNLMCASMVVVLSLDTAERTSLGKLLQPVDY